MRKLIEERLHDHQQQLSRLQRYRDEHMSVNIRQRDGVSLRYLHGQMATHRRVIEELELLLEHAGNGPL